MLIVSSNKAMTLAAAQICFKYFMQVALFVSGSPGAPPDDVEQTALSVTVGVISFGSDRTLVDAGRFSESMTSPFGIAVTSLCGALGEGIDETGLLIDY